MKQLQKIDIGSKQTIIKFNENIMFYSYDSLIACYDSKRQVLEFNNDNYIDKNGNSVPLYKCSATTKKYLYKFIYGYVDLPIRTKGNYVVDIATELRMAKNKTNFLEYLIETKQVKLVNFE